MNYLDRLYDIFESDNYAPESEVQYLWNNLTQQEKEEFAYYMGMSIKGVEEEIGLDSRFGSSKRKGSRKGFVSEQDIRNSYDKWSKLRSSGGTTLANANEFIRSDLGIEEGDNTTNALVIDIIDDIEGYDYSDPLANMTLDDVKSVIGKTTGLSSSDFSDPHMLYNKLFFSFKAFGNHPDGSDNINDIIFDNFNTLKQEFESRNGSRKGQDFTAHGIRNVAQSFKDVTGGQTGERMSNAWDTWDRKKREGSGPLNNLGPVSGKGSRPENLMEIASKVSLGRNRSINMDGEYVEEEGYKQEFPEVSKDTSREGGLVRDTAKFLANGAKVVGNGIHAVGDEIFDGVKDALGDSSTDFGNVSNTIKGNPTHTVYDSSEKMPKINSPFDDGNSPS